jgi:hypothetical protein
VNYEMPAEEAREIGNQFDHLIINFPFVMQND